MKVAVFGATGSVGVILVRQALETGHEVTAIARRPEILPAHPKLKAVKADLMNADSFANELIGHDAVLSAFGPRPDSPVGEQAALAEALCFATKTAGVRRVVVVSVAFLFGNALLPFIFGRLFFGKVTKGAALAEKVWTGSGLDWTILRPPQFKDGSSKKIRSRVGGLPPFGFQITREDVAAFMLVEAARADHVHQVLGIAN